MVYKDIVTLEDSKSPMTEIYRNIRTNIEYANMDRELKVISVTSTTANEAKSTVIANLAVMSANKEERVLIIDADLRRPSVHRFFRVQNEQGLTDLTRAYSLLENNESIDYESYIKEFRHEEIGDNEKKIHILTGGMKIVNPAEFLGSKAFINLVNFLKTKYDRIYIDTAPAGMFSDGVVVASASDGTVYVIESGRSKYDDVIQSVEALKQTNAYIIGTILTKVPLSRKDKHQYYDYYRYYNEQVPTKKKWLFTKSKGGTK
ncbi:Capsular exopolysaccharide family protein [Haloplasma contractile SSD-17B]|uniref:Capsular exopolysaccharide family protein n=2 Tax=Haloplasma TaxID=471824 RepID=U2DQS0_9MOLU|nr:Capsular exopolysaccharide family protein [Haloplasma contractile SSD-17B]